MQRQRNSPSSTMTPLLREACKLICLRKCDAKLHWNKQTTDRTMVVHECLEKAELLKETKVESADVQEYLANYLAQIRNMAKKK